MNLTKSCHRTCCPLALQPEPTLRSWGADTLAQYGQLKDLVAMLGLEQLSREDRSVVASARRLQRF